VGSITPRPRLTPGESFPGTHCPGGWVGPRTGLDADVRGKILCLCRGLLKRQQEQTPRELHTPQKQLKTAKYMFSLYFALSVFFVISDQHAKPVSKRGSHGINCCPFLRLVFQGLTGSPTIRHSYGSSTNPSTTLPCSNQHDEMHEARCDTTVCTREIEGLITTTLML
jgi:hypothetical protein